MKSRVRAFYVHSKFPVARTSWVLLISLLCAAPHWAAAGDLQEAEVNRLRGFAEHQSREAQFERARQRGETEFLEETEQWQRMKDKDLAEYRKQKSLMASKSDQNENSKAAREDAEVKREWEKEYDKSRQAFVKNRERFDRENFKGLVTEPEEFGLLAERPRYDYKKRALYGAPLKFGKAGPMPRGSAPSSGFSMGNPSGSPAPYGTGNFPPPPTFDDFGDGYIPPPNLGGGFGDDIPPPPPPPFPDDFGGGFNNDIPPPPPPPPFMDDGGDF